MGPIDTHLTRGVPCLSESKLVLHGEGGVDGGGASSTPRIWPRQGEVTGGRCHPPSVGSPPRGGRSPEWILPARAVADCRRLQLRSPAFRCFRARGERPPRESARSGAVTLWEPRCRWARASSWGLPCRCARQHREVLHLSAELQRVQDHTDSEVNPCSNGGRLRPNALSIE